MSIRLPSLVTFDIDGTLLHCPNGIGVRIAAFYAAARAFFGASVTKESVYDSLRGGSTDALVAKNLLTAHRFPVTPDSIENILHLYDKFYNKNSLKKPIPLPFASTLTKSLLRRKDLIVAIATGNTKMTAIEKLHQAGLDHLTEVIGGYSSIHINRADILKDAIKATKTKNFRQKVHVGDTPSDLRAALEAGFKPVILTTGIFPPSAFNYTPTFENLEHAKDYIEDLLKI